MIRRWLTPTGALVILVLGALLYWKWDAEITARALAKERRAAHQAALQLARQLEERVAREVEEHERERDSLRAENAALEQRFAAATEKADSLQRVALQVVPESIRPTVAAAFQAQQKRIALLQLGIENRDRIIASQADDLRALRDSVIPELRVALADTEEKWVRADKRASRSDLLTCGPGYAATLNGSGPALSCHIPLVSIRRPF